jgi:hypothetical protein
MARLAHGLADDLLAAAEALDAACDAAAAALSRRHDSAAAPVCKGNAFSYTQ